MGTSLKNILLLLIFSGIVGIGGAANISFRRTHPSDISPQQPDSIELNNINPLPYNFEDEKGFELPNEVDSSGLYLNSPSNIKTVVEYDPLTGEYVIYKKIGDFNYRLPKTLSLEEYSRENMENSIQSYWRQRNSQQDFDTRNGIIPELTIGGETFNRIFGGNTIDINPQGYVDVNFGYQVNKTENPSIPERLRKTPTFDFNQEIQMSVTGSIGEKMDMRVNYNTEASFDYENKMKLDYTGDEDEIIKKIEAGNVSLPLNGSLITGGTNLFGIKTEMQFGKLTLTTLMSQNKGETKVVETEGGAQTSSFVIDVSDYDENRHFFLSHYFYDTYDDALQNLPVVRSSITINKIEVWVTNKSGDYDESRNILALMDLGEHQENIYNTVPGFQDLVGNPYPENVYPFNGANNMYNDILTNYSGIREVDQVSATFAPLSSYNFIGGQDFEKIEQARKLSPSEYTVDPNLGYISLNSALNSDEVLAVAYNYTANGKTYQVGEFSTDGVDAPQTLVLKLLKGTNLSPKLPTWKLMMKNIYNLNAYELTDENFELNVLFLNDSTGSYINYLPESNLKGHILLNVLNLDNLNSQLDPGSDGVFDYIEGVTVKSSSGRVIFPSVEPFGSHLRDSLIEQEYIDKYTYQSLYDSIKVYAEQDSEHNKFILKGSYSGSSSSEISLGTFNLAEGSVRVLAGGVELTENVDYTVDYTLGRVKIINESILESGARITVSTESEDLFSVQRKTMLGTHANYAFSDNFNLGATALHLSERPLTQKVDYGEDAISNTILGLDATYSTESQLLTTLVDKLPFIETKERSTVALEAEFAQLLPGHSNVIGANGGTVYIDDFESTKTPINIKSKQAWVLASTPQNQSLFPEANVNKDLAYGYNRAKLAWYVIDPLFLRNTPQTPNHIKNDLAQKSNNLVREVFEQEIFPEKDTETGTPTNISVLDLAYYPDERGPYNFDTNGSSYSSGLNADGTLKDPDTRWGGIMREIETTNFESANIEYIEFWLMDPFVNDTLGQSEGGDLYFNLGDISEDILKDSRKSFENGLPETTEVTDVDTTIWGRVSTKQQITNSFVTNDDALVLQDVGLDGLSDNNEQQFFSNYVSTVQSILNPDVYQNYLNDPSGDDYHYFRGSDYDSEQLSILDRYKKYNGLEGNSVPASKSPESYTTSATTKPDVEDINDDNTLSEYEKYYQYRVSIRPEDMIVGENHIADIKEATVELADGKNSTVKWYQFKIPVKEPDQTIGNISDFKSIRFLRMFLKDFNQSVILRFATLDLVRSDWRRYTKKVDATPVEIPADTKFEISAVNVEENTDRKPIEYVLPPGVDRVIDPSSPQLLQLNEQSMVLKVRDLAQGDSRAAYKSIGMDFRQYERLRLDVHAEAIEGHPLDDNDLYFFIRVGSDYTSNYYEYEIPLKLTKPKAGGYSSDSESDRLAVWPNENRINVPLSVFTDVKLARNEARTQPGSSVSLTEIYEVPDRDWNNNLNLVKVKGSPNLGEVKVMMMGIRYKKQGSFNPGPRSVEVWANELRLTGYNEDGGWATNVRMSTRLADLGSVTMAGRYRSTGFGSLEQSVNQRSMEDLAEYDISSNFELGKFFPENAQVRIPLYVGVSKSLSNPKYNPLNPDITMSQTLRSLDSKSERDSIKNLVQDYTSFTSIVFNNIKVDKINKSGNPRLYDPTNFSLSFAHNIQRARDIDTKYSIEKNYRLSLNYNYSSRSDYIEPFSKLRGSFFGLLRSFNFAPLPTQISYRNELYRYYRERQARDITNSDLIIPVTVDKEFIWTRNFDLRYNLTRSLRLDFSSVGVARIDEPQGRINRHDDDYEMKKDSILTNLLDLGRPIRYNHSFNATYTIPINKIQLLNWVNMNARYQGTYNWNAGAITDESIELGNIINNSRTMQLNGQLSMNTLYNKIPFLNNVNQKIGSNTRGARSSSSQARAAAARQENNDNDVRVKEVTYSASRLQFKADSTVTITHNLKTEDVDVTAVDADGRAIRGDVEVLSSNQLQFTPTADAEDARITVTGQRTIENDIFYKIVQYTARTLMSAKTISITLNSNDATALPGFMPEPTFFGSGRYTPDRATFGDIASSTAPGFPFLLGWQDPNFARTAAEKGWITKDSTLNSPFIMSKSNTVSLRANLEPIPFLQITLSGDRRYSENTSEYYIYDTNTGNFDATSRTISGNFSMSVNTWKTAFSKMGNAEIEASDAYQKMMDNRIVIAQRLANRRTANPNVGYNPNDVNPATGFPVGYGETSQEVLIPAFIAAFTGQSPEKVSLSPFPSLKFLRPNWIIEYNGVVSTIEGLNKIFKSIDIRHSYRSTYNVGSFISNLDYNDTFWGDGWSYATNNQNNFVSQFDINSVSISESMNPLINLDLTWINDVSTILEINRTRNLTLNFANNQLTEILSREISIGLGYRFERMDLIIKTKNSQRAYSNDLDINVALSFRKNKTLLRKLVESNDQLTAGQNAIAIETTADYYLSDRFKLRLYYDKTINKPFTSSAFPTSNSNLGVSLRFTLTQ